MLGIAGRTLHRVRDARPSHAYFLIISRSDE
jgi:hypothetical protein